MGCGFSKFYDGEWYNTVVVCDYGVGGNVEGVHMYDHGEPCSACPAEANQCAEGLCYAE